MSGIQVREFREKFSHLSERTDVFSRNELKGTWFPGGHECPQNQMSVAEIDTTKAEMRKLIEQLEEDNRHLKKTLASRNADGWNKPKDATTPASPDPLDWLSDLPRQDKEYLSRKLGGRKK